MCLIIFYFQYCVLVIQIGLCSSSLILSFLISNLILSQSSETFIMVIVFFSSIINVPLVLFYIFYIFAEIFNLSSVSRVFVIAH